MSLPEELVHQLDEVAGPRNRSAFAEDALRRAIKRERFRIAAERYAGSLKARHPDQPILAGILEPVEFIQPGPRAAMLAGTWWRLAHERGYHLCLPDALIAAAADAVDAAVLTRNVRDFTLTPVRVETY